MTDEEARRLAVFVHDHDKRFEAKARTDGADSVVLLTRADDGTVLAPILSLAQYRTEMIDRDDPGPTVRAAWDRWQPPGGEH